MSAAIPVTDSTIGQKPAVPCVCPVRSLTVVVPCFNEADAIEQLVARLTELRNDLSDLDHFGVLIVDDGSSDDTWQVIQDATADLDWVDCLRHRENCGITAAIMTGLRAATTKYVATLDSDCTYDPLQMRQLLNVVDDQVCMVTASPYHPQGAVVGVPGWRLLLSKAASSIYSLATNASLHTYTSCFRVYRRSAFIHLHVHNQGFVGMAEIVWLAIRSGGSVKEAPAVLTSRRVGYSKLRTLPVIAGHIRLISQIVYQRFSRNY